MQDPQPEPEALIELSEVLTAVRRHWLLIAIIGFVSTATLTTIAFLTPPVYRAEVMLIAAEDNSSSGLPQLLGNLGGVAAMAGISFGSKSDVEVSVAMLKSKSFLSAFINENGLMQELYWKKWDSKAKQWKGDPADAPTMDDAVRMLDREIISVARDRRTGIITVGVEWTDRMKAAQWANRLVARLNSLMRQKAIDEARQSIDYLGKELTKTNVVELQQSIYHLTESQINRIVMANVRQEFAFKVIDPAVAPDAKYKLRPKRLLYMISGALLGGVLGLATAIFLVVRRRVRERVS